MQRANLAGWAALVVFVVWACLMYLSIKGA